VRAKVQVESDGAESLIDRIPRAAVDAASVNPIVQARYAACLADKRVLDEEVQELKHLLQMREKEQAAVVKRLEELSAFKPCPTLQRLQQQRQKMPVETGNSTAGPGGSNPSLSLTDDDGDDDDDYVSDDDEEQDEPAPPQPAHTLNPSNKEEVNEEQHVFDAVNAAMQVLVREQEDQRRGQADSKGNKLAMSVLDRCFFEVRNYIARLVESMPQRGKHGETVQAAPTNMIAGGSTQMGKTLFVTIGYLAAWFAECPLLCITTTVGGTKSLHSKVLKTLDRLEPFGAEGIPHFCMYLSGLTPGQETRFGRRCNKGNLGKAEIARAGFPK